MSKIVVIDEGGVKHGAIFAHMNNEQVPAVYTYLRMIIGYLKILKVTLEDTVIIAHDYGSWRKREDLEYKRQRQQVREQSKPPEWWTKQYNYFNDFYSKMETSLPFHHIKIKWDESDDVASTVCKYFKDDEKILCTRDRDWYMLCAFNNVKIFNIKTKTFMEVPNPYAILNEKINKGDISDNLLSRPSSEIDYQKRKRIVDLINLPNEITEPIIEELKKMQPKNLYLDKVPFDSVKKQVKQLYNL